MRIGLYGLPTAGKTYILNSVKSFEVLAGSSLLKQLVPEFSDLPEDEKKEVRSRLALQLHDKDNFIMDGHYSFGDQVVFTEEDGKLYDAFLYLYVNPDILAERMEKSARNRKYREYDLGRWQKFEIEALREYCHQNDKDFYVIDNPTKGFFEDISLVLEFLESVALGFSCVNFARNAVGEIGTHDRISLIDGDKTLIKEDSSAAIGYKTHIFDGNFYTGFQAWRHYRELSEYISGINLSEPAMESMDIHLNEKVSEKIAGKAVILTTGYFETWKKIADDFHFWVYYGEQMCSDTKYFITKFLQENGSMVTALGDSMNDYYMLKQADMAYLVLKRDGTASSSLKGKNLEGIECL